MIKQPILKRSIDRSIVVIVEIARIFYAKSIVTVFIILLCRPIFEDTNTTVAIIELDCALCLFDCSKNCWMQFLKNHQSKQQATNINQKKIKLYSRDRRNLQESFSTFSQKSDGTKLEEAILDNSTQQISI